MDRQAALIDWPERIEAMRTDWQAIHRPRPAFKPDRFPELQAEAAAIMDAGRWTSGPDDLLGVLGRRRDELVHSRLVGWLLVPTNKHALGRRVLRGLLDHVWPGEDLLAEGPVVVRLEEARAAVDAEGQLRSARADIAVRGGSLCLVIENKVDAGEGVDQCERLYWAFADQAADVRYVFLTPGGYSPTTALSADAEAAWRTLSYREFRTILQGAIEDAQRDPTSPGPASALQYLSSLTRIVPE